MSSAPDGGLGYDLPTCIDLVAQMIEAAERIVRRGRIVTEANDFVQTEAGIDAMDGIILMIIVLGETTKKLEKSAPARFLESYPEIDWKRIKGMRDVLSHEYFGIELNTLLDVTKEKVPTLLKSLQSIKTDLSGMSAEFNDQR